MFVLINNRDMNIHDIDKWIKDNRKANGGIISPEFAMEVLSKTNHLGHIKTIVNNIKERCDTPTKVAPYREFILSCVDGREMGNEVLENLRYLAVLNGSRAEFENINKKYKHYGRYDFEKVDRVISKSEFGEVLASGDNLVVCYDNGYLYGPHYGGDLSRIKRLILDTDMVELIDIKKLPLCLDLSLVNRSRIWGCDFGRVKKLKLKEGAVVTFEKVENLSSILDLSRCSEVVFEKCDLSKVDEIKFKKASKLILRRCENLPKVLDLSNCSNVVLVDSDFSGVEEIKLGEGCVLDLDGIEKFPKVLDLSQCYKVIFPHSDFGKANELKFKDREQENRFREFLALEYKPYHSFILNLPNNANQLLERSR